MKQKLRPSGRPVQPALRLVVSLEATMRQTDPRASFAAEEEELATVTKALARSRRLAELLRYIGDKYLAGRVSEITEYNIATEVFGRSKTVFNSGDDAIARVEAHRLRKRLRDYYAGEGRDHSLRISIPVGSYVPHFSRQSDDVEASDELPGDRNGYSIDTASAGLQPAAAAEIAEPVQTPGPIPAQAVDTRQPVRRWKVGMIWALVLLAVASLLSVWTVKRKANPSSATPSSTSDSRPLSTAVGLTGSPTAPVRIMAGYSGPPQFDSAGNTWMADTWFHNGGTWRREEGLPTSRTSDPLLFKQWRTGDFQYDIPLASGVYELHLYFISSDQSYQKTSSFYVSINGSMALAGFDVNSDAMGANIADERVIRDVYPSSDGYLHLAFGNESGTPALNALEVLPGLPHRQIPIRIVTQTIPLRDHKGQVWHPDTYFMNGRLNTDLAAISGDPDPDLFAAERFGHFDYALPVDPRGRYTLVLHFAEFYFGSASAAHAGVGSRVFRVICNGNTLLDDFDIYKEAGALHAVVKTFHHLKPTAQGKLNLTFEPIANNATISGIEVLDESN